MLLVDYKLTIGSTTYTVSSKSRLLHLQVSASLNLPVNACTIALSPDESLSLKPADQVSVELGYQDKQTLVFTGKISRVDWGIQQIKIEATSSFRALTIARCNRLYEKSHAGDIVKDLAQSQLELAIGKVENGLQFPVYAVGDRQTVYAHLRTLAQQCQMQFYADPQDKLVFAAYAARQTHALKYGVNILAFDLEEQQPAIVGVEVYGESPASQGQGDQAVSWLAQKAVKGSAGKSGAMTLRQIDATARTTDLASKIAAAYLTAASVKRRGRVRLLGDAKIQLGDGIQVSQMPIAAHNGTFRVTGVTHHLSERKGFYTLVDWEAD